MINTRVRHILQAVIFSAGLAVLLALAGYLCRPHNTDTSLANIRAFYGLEDDSADVLVFGSSKPLCGISPMVLYESYGITGYNDANLWQRINTTQLFVKDALRHQSPKVVVIEADNVNEYLWNIDMNGEIYYTRGIHWSADKLRYLKFCFARDAERYLSYLMPLYMFHENWKNMVSVMKDTAGASYHYAETFGYLQKDGARPQEIPDNTQTQQKQLREAAVNILEDIVDSCREAGAQVVFYISPCVKGFKFADAMETFCREHDCAFIDCFKEWDETGLDENTDFFDDKHLNASGARKLTEYLGEYLSTHYELADHRGEDNPWERQLQAMEG